MLRDRYTPVDLFALVPAWQLRFEPELAELDRLLEDDLLFQQVKADLAQRRPRTLQTGRPSTPVEVILRLLVLQHLYVWSFEQVEHFVNDSLVLRQFCRLGLEPVPHATTVLRWANVIQPETLHRLLDRVTELARSLKVTRGRKLRIDSTVVETAIHHPSDSGLLADGVRVLSRLVRRAGDLLARGTEPLVRDRTRSAQRLMRRIQASAAVTGRGAVAAAAERTELYGRLLEITRTSLRRAATVQRLLAAGAGGDTVERVRAQIEHFLPLVQQVCAQTQRRVLDHEQVPAADKLVSLFEPHTAVIRRGKLPVPTEFGTKLLLDEVDGGLVSRYVLLEGNPPDAPQLPASLDHHRRQFGHPPHTTAADRAFSAVDNEQYATQVGVQCVAIPHSGRCSAQRRAWEQRPAFRRAARFRAGIEGRISVLKRRFGLRRCRYHRRAGMERWVGWGILAHNLRQISQSVAARRAV
ncbi:MAG TPA: ISNCY family transposase [Chloroflexota bacterium]|nr:ISNCY family transposase [Chloroflexota bacterium]